MTGRQFRVLVTGSRHHADRRLIHEALDKAAADTPLGSVLVVVHGGAPGADRLADEWARLRADVIEVHPARWRRYGRKAGPLRNQAMVEAGADLCVAFPLGPSVGTWDCVGRARSAGIPVRVVTA